MRAWARKADTWIQSISVSISFTCRWDQGTISGLAQMPAPAAVLPSSESMRSLPRKDHQHPTLPCTVSVHVDGVNTGQHPVLQLHATAFCIRMHCCIRLYTCISVYIKCILMQSCTHMQYCLRMQKPSMCSAASACSWSCSAKACVAAHPCAAPHAHAWPNACVVPHHHAAGAVAPSACAVLSLQAKAPASACSGAAVRTHIQRSISLWSGTCACMAASIAPKQHAAWATVWL